jgi:hypothetical protein
MTLKISVQIIALLNFEELRLTFLAEKREKNFDSKISKSTSKLNCWFV